MQLILNNPYRIIGVIPEITKRELTKHIRRITKYLDTDAIILEDNCFRALGPLKRDLSNIKESESKLQLDADKVISLLFWFYNGNPIYDEPAFDAISVGDLKSATEIWLKVISKGEINEKNWSAFHNLSNLFLCNAFSTNVINNNLLEYGITLKIKYINSVHYVKVFNKSVDKSYTINRELIRDIFREQIYEELENYDDNYLINYFEILNKSTDIETDICFKNLIDKFIAKFDKRIKDAKHALKSDNKNTLIRTRTLISLADYIISLKSIIGADNVNMNSFSDRLADIIDQSALKIFNEYYNLENNYIDEVISFASKAYMIAAGNRIKENIDSNLKVFLEYSESKKSTENEKSVSGQIKIINILIDEYNKSEKTVCTLNNLLISCNPYLTDIKSKLGGQDINYIKNCNKIVELVIKSVENVSLNFNTGNPAEENLSNRNIVQLKSYLKKAWFVLSNIQFLYMTNEQLLQYNNLKENISNTLINLINRFNHAEMR